MITLSKTDILAIRGRKIIGACFFVIDAAAIVWFVSGLRFKSSVPVTITILTATTMVFFLLSLCAWIAAMVNYQKIPFNLIAVIGWVVWFFSAVIAFPPPVTRLPPIEWGFIIDLFISLVLFLFMPFWAMMDWLLVKTLRKERW